MSPNNKRQNNSSNSNKNSSRSCRSTRSQKAITKDKKDTVIADAYNSYKPPKDLRPDQQEAELEDVNMEDGTAASLIKKLREDLPSNVLRLMIAKMNQSMKKLLNLATMTIKTSK